ncbi:MAG: ATPase P [Lachnospiraceae bacterium]|nr:ATPase P [Lachnospiraceae bacterium]
MIFKPTLTGTHPLTEAELKLDKKTCTKIGPCGLGEQALYFNSFFIDRRYYARYEDIARVWKRVAMSKGGYSGKGVFGSMAYLIIKLRNGQEYQCNFKYEQNVDILLSQLEKKHPEIPTHSVKEEQALKREAMEEARKYKTDLSETAEKSIRDLRRYEDELKQKPAIYNHLAAAAKQKRVLQGISPTYKILAIVVFSMAIVAMIAGIFLFVMHSAVALYFVLFGIAFLFTIMATGILPTRKRNNKAAEKEWEQAREDSANYIQRIPHFPLPAQYAHPIVIERMIRAIRMGRCETAEEALELVKEDLKKLNSSVQVSQKEYDEVVVVKPLFLVSDYQ